MSDPAANIPERALPLNKSTVRPLRSAGRRPEAAVQRFSVDDLKNGQDFNRILNPGGGQSAAPETLSVPSVRPEQLPSAGQIDLTGQAGRAALAAQSRYLGRRNPEAGRLIKNKSADLTEEEKIGQLKKIKKSAEDYEGLLLKEMIKNLRQSPLAKTAGSETYSEIAEKPFTAAITAAGGLGLAEKIVSDVARQEGLSETLSEHPEIMGPKYRAKIAPSRMRKAPTRYNKPALSAE
jgi:Rod binding domain-containing protein